MERNKQEPSVPLVDSPKPDYLSPLRAESHDQHNIHPFKHSHKCTSLFDVTIRWEHTLFKRDERMRSIARVFVLLGYKPVSRSPARMMFRMQLLEPLACNVCVDLGGGDVRVAEQQLHYA